jgi:hypothetical protein
VPVVDSIACDNCKGSIPFSAGSSISHLNAPPVDVVSLTTNVCDESDKAPSDSGEEATSICSICVNVAAGTVCHCYGPHLSVAPSFVPPSFFLPIEPFSRISKPPQNRLV